ncbi:MAG: hypothetical protein ACFUZC_16625 [Chthoniobacteraceae bacterium]
MLITVNCISRAVVCFPQPLVLKGSQLQEVSIGFASADFTEGAVVELSVSRDETLLAFQNVFAYSSGRYSADLNLSGETLLTVLGSGPCDVICEITWTVNNKKARCLTFPARIEPPVTPDGAAPTPDPVAYPSAEAVTAAVAAVESLTAAVVTVQTALTGKADASALAGLQSAVTGLEGTIETVQAALDAKASSAAVTDLQTALATVQSALAGVQSTLETKADSSAVTALQNTLSAMQTTLTGLQTALDSKASSASLTEHVGDKTNPHGVTKAQVGLGSVDNTSDAEKPVSTAQAAANAAVGTAAAADATVKANAAQAAAIQRTNHTGTQSIATVDGLQDALASKAAASALPKQVTVADETALFALTASSVSLHDTVIVTSGIRGTTEYYEVLDLSNLGSYSGYGVLRGGPMNFDGGQIASDGLGNLSSDSLVLGGLGSLHTRYGRLMLHTSSAQIDGEYGLYVYDDDNIGFNIGVDAGMPMLQGTVVGVTNNQPIAFQPLGGNVLIGTAEDSGSLLQIGSAASINNAGLPSFSNGEVTVTRNWNAGTNVNVSNNDGMNAYFNATGAHESFFTVIALNNTHGLQVMRFGNLQDTFRIDRLSDDLSAIEATPFSLANDAPSNAFSISSEGTVVVPGNVAVGTQISVSGSVLYNGEAGIPIQTVYQNEGSDIWHMGPYIGVDGNCFDFWSAALVGSVIRFGEDGNVSIPNGALKSSAVEIAGSKGNQSLTISNGTGQYGPGFNLDATEGGGSRIYIQSTNASDGVGPGFLQIYDDSNSRVVALLGGPNNSTSFYGSFSADSGAVYTDGSGSLILSRPQEGNAATLAVVGLSNSGNPETFYAQNDGFRWAIDGSEVMRVTWDDTMKTTDFRNAASGTSLRLKDDGSVSVDGGGNPIISFDVANGVTSAIGELDVFGDSSKSNPGVVLKDYGEGTECSFVDGSGTKLATVAYSSSQERVCLSHQSSAASVNVWANGGVSFGPKSDQYSGVRISSNYSVNFPNSIAFDAVDNSDASGTALTCSSLDQYSSKLVCSNRFQTDGDLAINGGCGGSGSGTSGTYRWQMPFFGDNYKKVLVYLNGYTNTAAKVLQFKTGAGISRTFTNTPFLLANSTGITPTISTSQISLPIVSTAATGWIILEGF